MKKKDRNFDSLPLEKKIEMVEHLVVIHPQMQAILDKIDYCREHAKNALEPIGLLITGEKGAGKTTIKNICLKKNPPFQTETATITPILSILIPVPATVGGLNTCLLMALDDPFPFSGSITV